ncbi:hypothetical protein P3697_20865 [Vibrio parahaemolyticus]|nr:hypothetical protein [Vibrio parahaemolyticus]MDF5073404.1 hypothetical protein [Vibrio parahaemolyticus]MDF5304476.1 hypothetical protein [Vibrio parahaemolyticus]
MAKKARLFNVCLGTGYGTNWYFYPGQSIPVLKGTLESETVKVIDIKFVGWFDIDVIPSVSEISFVINIGENQYMTINNRDVGYDYLYHQFYADVLDIRSGVESSW